MNMPVCEKTECCYNNIQFPNKCKILTWVDGCPLADIVYPTLMQRAFAWCGRYWPVVAFIAVVVTLLIFWSLLVYGAAIEIRPNELAAYTEKIERETDNAEWQRLWIKHGRPTSVVYEPRRTPYFVNKHGQKCRFI